MAEILSYDFMQRAILAVIAISVFAPILGIFLILRHQSLMSDTLSHVSLAGVALGILLGVSTTWSTVIVVTIAAVILEYLQTVYKHYMEISTAILMSLGLAIALIVTSKSDNGNVNLEQYHYQFRTGYRTLCHCHLSPHFDSSVHSPNVHFNL